MSRIADELYVPPMPASWERAVRWSAALVGLVAFVVGVLLTTALWHSELVRFLSSVLVGVMSVLAMGWTYRRNRATAELMWERLYYQRRDLERE